MRNVRATMAPSLSATIVTRSPYARCRASTCRAMSPAERISGRRVSAGVYGSGRSCPSSPRYEKRHATNPWGSGSAGFGSHREPYPDATSTGCPAPSTGSPNAAASCRGLGAVAVKPTWVPPITTANVVARAAGTYQRRPVATGRLAMTMSSMIPR